jgi:glyoxylase-like metal-dependent hydrolase (beta-lactamase superfamily II)
MTNFVCSTCGTQFAATEKPPECCAICEDPRQYVPPAGQQWTTLEELRATHRNSWQSCEPGLFGIGTVPDFAIGQRALLLRTNEGNFLWDCISLLDQATVELLHSLGGLRGIAISHPHYYTTMVEWSHAFDDAPIYLHAADRQWVMRPDKAIQFWEEEEKELAPGLTLLRCGGHFPGATILHWRDGAEGRGALLTGDILQVTPDEMVSFMFSYPNLIPLPAAAVEMIGQKVAERAFDRIYGPFWERTIPSNAREKVRRSVTRYLAAIDSLGWAENA